MVSRVALVRTDMGVSVAYQHALDLIGGISDLNVENRPVTIKLGIFDERNLNYPTVKVVKTVTESFIRSNQIFLVESDNYQGKAEARLQVWKNVFSGRVVPYSLSNDPDTRIASICGEKIPFSMILFKPNVFVSLHVLREGIAGSIFKNLLGLVPDIKKDRFHDMLGLALVDMAEAIGWIDLAIIDGTYSYMGEWKEGEPLDRIRRNLLIVGRDPVAVETVGSIVTGGDPYLIPAIVEAKKRNMGESDINRIEVVGESIENVTL